MKEGEQMKCSCCNAEIKYLVGFDTSLGNTKVIAALCPNCKAVLGVANKE